MLWGAEVTSVGAIDPESRGSHFVAVERDFISQVGDRDGTGGVRPRRFSDKVSLGARFWGSGGLGISDFDWSYPSYRPSF